ncbi:hypothetical protein [Faecalibacterium prausnitzii]|uniref:Uncharacterized protein n=1 Tax=Faecalibacterium prausnitzii TaxID=853 RepID=A0A291T9D4_9FIRM|nr:hypothetical protein [Faecalibacterium prausnitzii]ATL89764.1 hypothetical protein CRH10_05375 [Faecalibacterium prausnitzii]
MIISQNSNDVYYAYTRGRFWRWEESARVWKESHLLAQKFGKAKTAEKRLTPEAFLTSDEFIPMDDCELPEQMLTALRDAKPCKNAPIEPVEEKSAPAASAGGSSAPIPSAPSFDFGADEQTNALLLQDAQTFITGNMARIMAAKHAHDLCANNKNGTWGKWCDVVGISRDTGDNMVHIAERFGNIQIEGKPIFDVQPLKLLYAVAKPSAPAELVEQVKTGDITTYKEYQELLAQVKAEKDRADAAETERDKLLGAQNRAAWAESHIQDVEAQRDAALADVQGLTEQNAKLQQSYHDADEGRIAARLQCQKAEGERDRAEERAKDAENQLAGSRQMAEAAKLRGDKLKAENDALKKQPITTVVDKEEVERQAREMAAEMTADLRAQLEQAASGSEQDAHSSYDNVLLADRSFQNIGKMVVPSLRRLPPEQREQLTNMLVHTLGQIQGEVSRCL